MKKVISLSAFLLGFAVAENAFAQKEKEGIKIPDINLLLRSSLEIPTQKYKQSSLKQNEARLEIKGKVIPQLEYRVRYRLTRGPEHRVLDNSPSSLDIAYVNYRFGDTQKYSLTVGKQAAFAGNWEFENNPTFEYQYSEHVNNQLNLFLLAAKLGIQANENNSFHFQLHNTVNDTFDELYTLQGFVKDNYTAARFPLGLYIAWRGDMNDKRFQTFWSYNASQIASGVTNHMVSLGNRYALGSVEGYLDLSYASNPVDFIGVATSAVKGIANASSFAKDVNYTTGAFRINYNFAPQWYLTGKAFIDHSKGQFSDTFKRQNLGLLGGLEFKPFASEDMKLFGYYFYNKQRINYTNQEYTTNNGLISFGVLYFVNAVKQFQ